MKSSDPKGVDKEMSRRLGFFAIGSAFTLLCWGPATLRAGGQHGSEKVSDKAREQAEDGASSNLDVLVRFRHSPGWAEKQTVQSFGGSVQRRHRPSSRWLS